jgi:hypothetical protein
MAQTADIENLQIILQVPISNINYQQGCADIYSDGTKIGTLFTYRLATVTTFDTAQSEVNKLNWMTIFQKYKEEFTTLVAKELPDQELLIVPATFGHIYVKDRKTTDLLGYYKCTFLKSGWQVFKSA